MKLKVVGNGCQNVDGTHRVGIVEEDVHWEETRGIE